MQRGWAELLPASQGSAASLHASPPMPWQPLQEVTEELFVPALSDWLPAPVMTSGLVSPFAAYSSGGHIEEQLPDLSGALVAAAAAAAPRSQAVQCKRAKF